MPDKNQHDRVRIVTSGNEEIEIPRFLPVLPVRDAVVFPGVTAPLAIGREQSLAALERAGEGGYMIVATQRDPNQEEPTVENLYPICTIVRIVKVMDARSTSGAGKHAVVVGLVRNRMTQATSTAPCLVVEADPLLEDSSISPEENDAWEEIVTLSNRVIDLREDIPEEWKNFVASIDNPSLLADLIVSTLPLNPVEKVNFLSEAQLLPRLRRVADYLRREVTIAEAQYAMRSEAEEMDPKRRERLLRKRMRTIQEELGETDAGIREVDELREKIEAANLPPEAHKQTERELRRLAALPQHAPDRHLIRTYLEWMADLPWSVETEDYLDLHEARRVLDEDHYGLEKIKDRILEYLAVRKLAPNAKAPILCFVGPPGVGKTSLGKSIARAMHRKFTRAALGGVRDEAEIRGHRRTYVGAMPGKILQNIRRAGSRNPVYLLDEVDKLGADFRGDPSSALLEVLDPEQNNSFSDHYIEVPFDLSRVLFIATANTLSTIPIALLDRMEIIELPGYTEQEKLAIAEKYLVTKQLEAHGLSADQVSMQREAIERVVHEYTREAGVRNLDRFIATLMRKAAHRIAETHPSDTIVMDAAFVKEALKAPPHLPETAERTEIPGVVVGLARTNHGGDILFIEATTMTGGQGVRLRLTGQLGDVMRESAEAALSWVRANAKRLGLDAKVLEGGEIHLHVPAGAVPKDGPSAGAALATAIVSALSGKHARGDVAMTGEISLRGFVLPVGGIKDKVLAAARAGIKKVLLPQRNKKDVQDIPAETFEKLEIQYIETIDEALDATLCSTQ